MEKPKWNPLAKDRLEGTGYKTAGEKRQNKKAGKEKIQCRANKNTNHENGNRDAKQTPRMQRF